LTLYPDFDILRGIMSNLDSLKAAYQTHIANITDPLLSAHATVALDEYIALKTAVATLNAVTLDSYSIAQRSVQRRRILDAETACRQKELELNRALFGVTSVALMNGDENAFSI
jgi:hypothetical protein